MSNEALEKVIKQFTPCDKCGCKTIFRDYDEEGVILYCYKCGTRFYPAKSLLKRIAIQVDGA